MRISAKARYGLATMTYFAMRYPYQLKFTVSEVSEALRISKIYLEQVFSQLRMAGIVQATKGPQGGYSLTRKPGDITAYDILSATEAVLFDQATVTVEDSAGYIEQAMHDAVYQRLDETVKDTLSAVTLEELSAKASANNSAGYMYYL